jgi:hypothetical protein
MRKPSAIAAAALVVLALAGCASQGAGSIPAPAATTSPAGTLPATGLATASPSCVLSCGGQVQHNGPAALPAPSWAPGDKAAALAAAVAAMGAYIRPGTDHATWFTGIRPRVTDQFAAELGKFDPTYLTVSKMTGPATASPDPKDSFQLDVSVPTDDGVYQVTMLRSTQTAPWLANSIIPPLPGDK